MSIQVYSESILFGWPKLEHDHGVLQIDQQCPVLHVHKPEYLLGHSYNGIGHLGILHDLLELPDDHDVVGVGDGVEAVADETGCCEVVPVDLVLLAVGEGDMQLPGELLVFLQAFEDAVFWIHKFCTCGEHKYPVAGGHQQYPLVFRDRDIQNVLSHRHKIVQGSPRVDSGVDSSRAWFIP